MILEFIALRNLGYPVKDEHPAEFLRIHKVELLKRRCTGMDFPSHGVKISVPLVEPFLVYGWGRGAGHALPRFYSSL
jgi:hypothetical protein